MAKTIKFNLILDGQPVRDLDGLREHFNVEDILKAHRSGLLERWLETRGLENEIAALATVPEDDDVEAARELCRVFHGDFALRQVEAAAYPFMFRRQEAEELQRYTNLREQKDEILRAHHEGYERLLAELLEKGDDYPFVKSAVSELFRNYLRLYRLDAVRFYYEFVKEKPLVILALLVNEKMRPIIVRKLNDVYRDLDFLNPRGDDIARVFENYKKSENKNFPWVMRVTNETENRELRQSKKKILMLSCTDNHSLDGKIVISSDLGENYYPYDYVPLANILRTSFPNYVKSFAGETEGYWKDLVSRGTKCLLIQMQDGNFVRNAGKNGEELKAEDVNGKFPILDGIDYKSNNAAHRLVYVEI